MPDKIPGPGANGADAPVETKESLADFFAIPAVAGDDVFGSGAPEAVAEPDAVAEPEAAAKSAAPSKSPKPSKSAPPADVPDAPADFADWPDAAQRLYLTERKRREDAQRKIAEQGAELGELRRAVARTEGAEMERARLGANGNGAAERGDGLQRWWSMDKDEFRREALGDVKAAVKDDGTIDVRIDGGHLQEAVASYAVASLHHALSEAGLTVDGLKRLSAIPEAAIADIGMTSAAKQMVSDIIEYEPRLKDYEREVGAVVNSGIKDYQGSAIPLVTRDVVAVLMRATQGGGGSGPEPDREGGTQASDSPKPTEDPRRHPAAPMAAQVRGASPVQWDAGQPTEAERLASLIGDAMLLNNATELL